MPPVHIRVDKGYVSSRSPAELEDGELAKADDSEYRVGSGTVWRIPGRKAYNSATVGGPIQGARFLAFDGKTDRFIVSYEDSYAWGEAGETGAFEDVKTGLVGSKTLDAVHYNNSHFLLNGADRNQEFDGDGSVGSMGMLANAVTNINVTDTGTGTGFSLSSGSTIKYWAELRVKDADGVITRRSADIASRATLTGAGATVKPVVTLALIQDSEATHWALYGTATNAEFPIGAEIEEVAIATLTIEDTRTAADPPIPSGEAYKTISVQLAGVTNIVAKHGEPPVATTGDVAEDSIVANDITDRSRVRYSFPDDPHAWPAVNFIRFETKEEDEVRFIRYLGRFTMVGMRDTFWRIETLPRPEDASFQPERVKYRINGAQGIVNSEAGAIFSFGDGDLLAWVSPCGLLYSNGFQWDSLTDDLRWKDEVDVGRLNEAILTNNRNEYRLEMDAWHKDGTRKAWFLHYHPSHAKTSATGKFRAKVTGPITREATAAFAGTFSGCPRYVSGHEDGKLYIESIGSTDESGGTIHYLIKTGDRYPAGVGHDVFISRTYFAHEAFPLQNANITMTTRTSGLDDDLQIDKLDFSRREPTPSHLEGNCQAVQYTVEDDGTDRPINVILITAEVDSLGETTA